MPTLYEYWKAEPYKGMLFGGADWFAQTFRPQISHIITEVALQMYRGACVVEGTPIHTPQGMIPVQRLEKGSFVYSFDFREGITKTACVFSSRQAKADSFLKIYTTRGHIQVTKGHPFFVIGHGWEAAKDLKIGDALQTRYGKERVIGIDIVNESCLVYNPIIENYHTYFVEDSRFLVHNKTDVIVSIRNCDLDVAGIYGDDLTAATFLMEDLTEDRRGEWKLVPLPGHRLISGTDYAIVARSPDAPSGEGQYPYWNSTSVKEAGDYPRGVAAYSHDSGESWSAWEDHDFMFEEWGVSGIRVRHHHPTIPTDPNRGNVLRRMGSLRYEEVHFISKAIANGCLGKTDSPNYAATHDAKVGMIIDELGSSLAVIQASPAITEDETWWILRTFIEFDTSSVSVYTNITAAELHLYVTNVVGAFNLEIQKGNAYPKFPVADNLDDYDISKYADTVYGSLAFTGEEGEGWVTVPITNLGLIKKASTTKMVLRSSGDIDNDPTKEFQGIVFDSIEDGHTPYLVLTCKVKY